MWSPNLRALCKLGANKVKVKDLNRRVVSPNKRLPNETKDLLCFRQNIVFMLCTGEINRHKFHPCFCGGYEQLIISN